jgi:hypothetical protein
MARDGTWQAEVLIMDRIGRALDALDEMSEGVQLRVRARLMERLTAADHAAQADAKAEQDAAADKATGKP